MNLDDPKTALHSYLHLARDALVWKLDGLPEYDVRRPMTPTGTNLLGLVKHLASVEAGYFGATFERPFPEVFAWELPAAELNADMWATEDETRAEILDVYARARAHADVTIESLPLDATGRVQWWPADRNPVSLHRILVHVIAETNRHAGHADIVRELADGAVGLRQDNPNMAQGDRDWWEEYRSRVEQAACAAAGPGAPR